MSPFLCLSLILGPLLVSYQARAEGADHSEHEEHQQAQGEDGHEAIKISATALEAAKITLAEAGPGTIKTTIPLTGEVRLNGDHTAHLMPRFSGIVRRVERALGDRVTKGDLLAVVESNESLSSFEIRSPIAGLIIDKHATLGELIQESNEAFVVADLSTVWVDLNVNLKDLRQVRKGQAIVISADDTEADAEATIANVQPVINVHTRSALARVVMDNAAGEWRPGMFVTAQATTQTKDVPLVVKKTAIQTIKGEPTVFVQTSKGFVPTTVVIGASDRYNVEIKSGLTPQARYALPQTPGQRAADQQVHLAEARLALEMAQRAVDIEVRGGLRHERNDRTTSLLAGVAVPLPLLDRRTGPIASAQAELAAVEAQREGKRAELLRTLQQVYGQCVAALREASTLKNEILPSAKQASQSAMASFLTGRLSYLEVIESQKTMFDVRTQYIDALVHVHQTYAQLERLVGHALGAS